jgi:hypothetical protein
LTDINARAGAMGKTRAIRSPVGACRRVRSHLLSAPADLAQAMEATVTDQRKNCARVLGFTALALAALLLAGAWPTGAAAQRAASFKEDVFPIIQIRCLECHQPKGLGYEKSGLDLRTYEGLMKGTKFGSIVAPGRWIESNLLAVIDRRTSPEIWMPHDKRQLSKCERLTIRHWVMQGARNN